MSKLFIATLLLVVCLYFVSAAVVRQQTQLLDASTAISKIIAEYNRRYPGPSQVYPPEVARYIDPNTFRLN